MASKRKKKAASKTTTAPRAKTTQTKTRTTTKTKTVERKVAFGATPTVPVWSLTLEKERAFEIVYQPGEESAAPLLKPAKVLEGHSQFVQAIAFSPDGQLLATGSEDGTMRVWDLSSGPDAATCIKTGDDHASAVNGVSFTADGRYLLTASDDHSVKVWRVPSFDVVRTLEGHTDYVSKVYPAGPPGGSSRAVSSSKDGSVRLWDLDTGECLRVMDHGGWTHSLGVSHDGRRAVAGSDRNVLRIWDLSTGNVERVLLDASDGYIGDVMGFSVAAENQTDVGHRNAAKHFTFASDDKTFLSSETDIIVWETSSGAELVRIDGDGWPMAGAEFMPDRASALRKDVDPKERAFLEQLRAEANPPLGGDGNEAAAVRSVYGDWLEEKGRIAEAIGVRRHGAARHVLAAGRGKVHVFDLVSRAIVAQAQWNHGDSRRVAVSPDGRWGACGSDDGAIGLWDLDALVRAGMPDRHLSSPNSVAISQDGVALTASSDRTVRLWSRDGKTSQSLPITDGLFLTVTFTPDGRVACVMTDHGQVSTFDASSGAPLGTASYGDDRHHTIGRHVFLRDGRMLVGSVSGPLAIWTVNPTDPSPHVPLTLKPPLLFNGEAGHVIGLAVDEEADLIVTAEYASGDEPMPIKLWSLSERSVKLAITIKAETSQYCSAVAIVDDRIVLTTSDGGLLILDQQDGAILDAFQVSERYLDSLVALSDGRVVIGGTELCLVDVRNGKLLSRIQWASERQTQTIEGTTKALVYSAEGMALIDYATSRLSAFTPTPPAHSLATSPGGELVVMMSSDKEFAGRPIVLRLTR